MRGRRRRHGDDGDDGDGDVLLAGDWSPAAETEFSCSGRMGNRMWVVYYLVPKYVGDRHFSSLSFPPPLLFLSPSGRMEELWRKSRNFYGSRSAYYTYGGGGGNGL